MKCSRNFQKDGSTEIERLQKTQTEKGKSEKVVAEGTKVKTNLSTGRNSEGDRLRHYATNWKASHLRDMDEVHKISVTKYN
jgi:hypothetical protein